MEKAKISQYQLFVLIILFELGSALLVPLASDAKQDAWIAILLGMVGGMFAFYVYYRLFLHFPDQLPTSYAQKLIGPIFGRILAFLYTMYYLYIAARVLRDNGEMLTVLGYNQAPLAVILTLFVCLIVYTIRKGIEVLARTGEVLFIFVCLLTLIGFLLILGTDLIKLSNLKPVLEEGFSRPIKIALQQTIYFPFGEIVAFAMILPYLNNPRKAKFTGFLALGISGVALAITMMTNISVLGMSLISRTQFPLLTTIQSIHFAEYSQRFDIFYMVVMIIIGFIKISLFFYAGLIGVADLFKVKEPSKLAFSGGFGLLICSLIIASNMTEHMKEGLEVVTMYLHLPFQYIIPVILLMIAFMKKKS